MKRLVAALEVAWNHRNGPNGRARVLASPYRKGVQKCPRQRPPKRGLKEDLRFLIIYIAFVLTNFLLNFRHLVPELFRDNIV